jgi:hypothetical protein
MYDVLYAAAALRSHPARPAATAATTTASNTTKQTGEGRPPQTSTPIRHSMLHQAHGTHGVYQVEDHSNPLQFWSSLVHNAPSDTKIGEFVHHVDKAEVWQLANLLTKPTSNGAFPPNKRLFAVGDVNTLSVNTTLQRIPGRFGWCLTPWIERDDCIVSLLVWLLVVSFDVWAAASSCTFESVILSFYKFDGLTCCWFVSTDLEAVTQTRPSRGVRCLEY